ncbi:MAG: helix-turn-helix domain-containing protein [Holosporaceae bacterium]|jgi:transcriptional regulator with XRE-family HTH domain|nr:helix-turn-helix domain-containing protein [Holosporaceae bacterium]
MTEYSQVKTSKKSRSGDLDFYIGSRVKSRRSALGISQDKLGSYLGITFQQIQKYEKGANRISASTLYSIANALSIDFSYFVDGYQGCSSMHDENAISYEFNNLKKRESIELLRAYYKILNPALRKKILDMIKAFSSSLSKDEETSLR